MVHGRNACAKQKEALHEPSEFERCCGWVLPARGYPTQPRSVEKQVQGSNATAKRKGWKVTEEAGRGRNDPVLPSDSIHTRASISIIPAGRPGDRGLMIEMVRQT